MTWYVVHGHWLYDEPPDNPDDDAQVWTVSKRANVPGWNTDGGYDGYGLTKADAKFLVDAANTVEAMSRAPTGKVAS